MQKVLPGVGERMLTRLRLSALASAEAEVFADILAEELVDWPEGAWLAVDDYQEIGGVDACETFFAALVSRSAVKVLVTSRTRPSWASARSLLYANHFELGQEDLAMTPAEAVELLRDPRALELARGWPALVSLAASASRTPPEGEVFDSGALHAFFVDDLFRAVDPELQHALCELALCPDLSLRVIDTLYGPTLAPSLVRSGARAGLLSLEGDLVSLHPLIRRFLTTKAFAGATVSSARLAAIATLLIEEHCWDEAFEVIARTKSAQLLATLVEAALPEMLDQARHDTLRKWVALARDLRGGALGALLLAEAELASREGRQDRAEALATQAAQSPGSNRLRGRAWNVAGRSAHLRDRYERALECHRLAAEYAEQEADLTDAVWGQMAAGWHVDPELSKSLVPKLATLGTDLDTRIRVAMALMSGVLQAHEPAEGTADVTEEALILVEHAQSPLVATSFLNVVGRWCVLRGDYKRALRIVDWEMRVVEQHRLAFVLPNALNARAMALTGLRDWTGAARALSAAESRARDFDDIHNEVDALTIRLRLLLSRRSYGEALHAAERSWSRQPGRPQETEFLATRAMVYASAAPVDTAVDVVASLPGKYSGEVVGIADAAKAILAVRGGGQSVKDVQAFAQRVREVGCVDPLVVAIRAYPPLLDVLIDRCDFREDAEMIIERIRDRSLARRLHLPSADVPDSERGLSKRETEVLELLAQGLPNREIARLLFIEEVTVKVHVRHIFEKLGVRTRIEAATRYVTGG